MMLEWSDQYWGVPFDRKFYSAQCNSKNNIRSIDFEKKDNKYYIKFKSNSATIDEYSEDDWMPKIINNAKFSEDIIKSESFVSRTRSNSCSSSCTSHDFI